MVVTIFETDGLERIISLNSLPNVAADVKLVDIWLLRNDASCRPPIARMPKANTTMEIRTSISEKPPAPRDNNLEARALTRKISISPAYRIAAYAMQPQWNSGQFGPMNGTAVPPFTWRAA